MTETAPPAAIDVELLDGADFVVRRLPDGTYSVELGAAAEIVRFDDLVLMATKLADFLGWD